IDHGFAGLDEALIVTGTPPVSRDPGIGPLDHPPPGKDGEALHIVAALDDLKIDGKLPGRPPQNALVDGIGISAVHPAPGERREMVFSLTQRGPPWGPVTR